MIITLIAAIGKNNELGKGNDLLWKFPADQKHFRDRTMGHTMIMGRKTFESLPGLLPKRRHIVITRDKNYDRKGIEVVNSLPEALDLAGQKAKKDEEVFVIGGGEIFRQAIELADKLDITHFDAEDKKADVFFPEIIPILWNEVTHEEQETDDQNPIPYTFSIYEKF